MAEKDPEGAKRLNITVSRQMAEVARDLNIVLIYIRFVLAAYEDCRESAEALMSIAHMTITVPTMSSLVKRHLEDMSPILQ